MKKVSVKPKAHIFICTHTRPEGESSCGRVGGGEFFSRLKEELTQKGMRSERWITRSGCLGFCNNTGCVAVIYKSADPLVLTEIVPADYAAVWRALTE